MIRAPVIAIMIMQVAALFARAFLELHLIDSGESRAFARHVSYLVVPPILITLLYPVLRQHWSFLRSMLSRDQMTLRMIVMAVILGLSLRMTYWGGLISLVSFGVWRNPDPGAFVGPEISFGCPALGFLALSLLVVAFLTPIIEEVINRGLILPSLLNRGTTIALLLSSVLFAILHKPQTMPLAFAMGLFLGLQMINNRSLWPPLITHATYNAMTVIDWDCIQSRWNPTEVTPGMVGTGMIATGLAVIGIALSVVLVTQKNIGAQSRPNA